MSEPSLSPPELDELDFRIIGQLQDDGRKPTAEIARALGVPRTTVARRVERLVRDKIITVGAFAHGPKIGLPVQAMILLQVAPNQYDAVVSAIVALDEVRWVGILSGPFDLLIEAMLPSNEALRRLLLEKLARIAGITRMQTAQVLEVAKIAFDWNRMLHADRPADGSVGRVAPARLRAIQSPSMPGRGEASAISVRRRSRPQRGRRD
jgi:Lrp/AsnC family transcriptional regulator for asnA, asnC and gidA